MLEDLYHDLGGSPLGDDLEEGEIGVGLQSEEESANEENENNAVGDYDISQNEPQAPGPPVEPKKKRVVKNPQPKLDPERLRGPRGISILESVFKDFKFRGKGCEPDDLNHVMKRLEHWAHRLFPRFQFDDTLEKLETLGHKKPVITYIKRIRMGIEACPTDLTVMETEEDGDERPEVPFDLFDELITEKHSQNQSSNTLVAPSVAAPSFSPERPRIVLTPEQRERIRRNRLLAEEKQMARLKAFQENQLVNAEKTQEAHIASDVTKTGMDTPETSIERGLNEEELP